MDFKHFPVLSTGFFMKLETLQIPFSNAFFMTVWKKNLVNVVYIFL